MGSTCLGVARCCALDALCQSSDRLLKTLQQARDLAGGFGMVSGKFALQGTDLVCLPSNRRSRANRRRFGSRLLLRERGHLPFEALVGRGERLDLGLEVAERTVQALGMLEVPPVLRFRSFRVDLRRNRLQQIEDAGRQCGVHGRGHFAQGLHVL